MYVRSIMFKEPIRIRPEASFYEAQWFMGKNRIRHLPVVDDSNNLLGIITTTDLRAAAPSDAINVNVHEIQYLLARLTVSDIMVPLAKLVTVTPEVIVEEAVKLMLERKIGSLPVVADGKLVGLVTETDILTFFVDVMGLNLGGTKLTVAIEDQPGTMSGVLKIIGKHHVNIISIYSPTFLMEGKRHAVIRIQAQSYEDIVKDLNAEGYEVISVEQLPSQESPH